MLRANGTTKKRSGSSRKARSVGEVLTVEQIHGRYKSQWVLLRDPVHAKGPRLIKGEVVAHSKDRDEIGREAIRLKLKSSAFLFTGPVTGDFIL
jgi:hypothetical protein